MERYTEYKDTGIYYIPYLPSEWKVQKAKYLFKQEKRTTRANDEIVTCFRDGQVTLRKNRRLDGFTNSMKEIGYQGIRKGDLVIHNMDAFAGAIGVSDSDGKGTPVYACCTPLSKSVNQYYYCFLLRSLAHNGFILSLAKGIRERSTDFRFNDFKELLLPVPSIDEQKKIVIFLEEQIKIIDNAIVQQQKMIDLLNERKQIIINNAVTKGLNPNAKMKDSGIDWIGEIPEGWEVKKIKHLCTVNDEVLPENSGDLNIKYIEIGDVDFNYGIIGYSEYKFKEAPSRARRITRKGDVIISTVRTYLKAIAKIEEDGFIVSTGFAVLRGYNINPDFLAYALMTDSFVLRVLANSVGVSYPAITANDLTSLQIVIPPRNLQNEIVKSLNKQTKIIENSINSFKKKITLLQERKQIIINEVVTGKVKV